MLICNKMVQVNSICTDTDIGTTCEILNAVIMKSTWCLEEVQLIQIFRPRVYYIMNTALLLYYIYNIGIFRRRIHRMLPATSCRSATWRVSSTFL